MINDIYDIAIIGGGASGLMLAASLDLAGHSGIILEATSKVGTKLLMSGGGRCNITHGGSIKGFLAAYAEAGPKLRKILYRHSNYEMASFLATLGLALSDESGEPIDLSRGVSSLDSVGRIFPSSLRASDVLNALISKARAGSWQIETNAKVESLSLTHIKDCRPVSCSDPAAGNELTGGSRDNVNAISGKDRQVSLGDGEIWKIGIKNRGSIEARNVVVAAGGITYPETGSDGSMLDVLRNLGVTINAPRPALAPVCVSEFPYSELAGISLRGVQVSVFDADSNGNPNRKAAQLSGDLLFTRTGFSGPVILNISRYATPGSVLRIKYNSELSSLPKRMQRILMQRSKGESGDIKTSLLSSLLDRDDFIISSVDSHGMVTAGGVALSEIDLSCMRLRRFPGSMQPSRFSDSMLLSQLQGDMQLSQLSGNTQSYTASEDMEDMNENSNSGDYCSKNKNVRAHRTGSLYVIGEAIDADGITGGYNLQLCYSTARCAADALSASLQALTSL